MSTRLAMLSLPSQLPGNQTSNRNPVTTTDRNHDAVSESTSPDDTDTEEDEHTISAYGDISLDESDFPRSEASDSSSPLQSKYSHPQLRLKLRRPPMPKKRRVSYAYVLGPLPYAGSMESDARWPGSPRPFVHNPPWAQHQPLAAPLSVPNAKLVRTPETPPSTKKSGSSIEKLVDELIPRPPSIKLSPPGSPANRALNLQKTPGAEEKSGAREGRNGADNLPSSSPPHVAAPPQQNKPKESPWRTRLPPRLPIPKWDM